MREQLGHRMRALRSPSPLALSMVVLSGLVIARGTSLTSMLADDAYFGRFFLELGALSWPNGFELAPAAIHRQLRDRGSLKVPPRVA